MPYAIFSDDEQISKAFPTEADVWKHARENGLVVEVHDHDDKEAEEFLDNEYRVLPCDKDGEDPERNEREAREAALTSRQSPLDGSLKIVGRQ
jgi:hypothetical protein